MDGCCIDKHKLTKTCRLSFSIWQLQFASVFLKDPRTTVHDARLTPLPFQHAKQLIANNTLEQIHLSWLLVWALRNNCNFVLFLLSCLNFLKSFPWFRLVSYYSVKFFKLQGNQWNHMLHANHMLFTKMHGWKNKYFLHSWKTDILETHHLCLFLPTNSDKSWIGTWAVLWYHRWLLVWESGVTWVHSSVLPASYLV